MMQMPMGSCVVAGKSTSLREKTGPKTTNMNAEIRVGITLVIRHPALFTEITLSLNTAQKKRNFHSAQARTNNAGHARANASHAKDVQAVGNSLNTKTSIPVIPQAITSITTK